MVDITITGTLTATSDDTAKGIAVKVYEITAADGTVYTLGEPAGAFEADRVPVVDGKVAFNPTPRGVVGDNVTVETTDRIFSDGRLHFYGEDWTVAR